ncbi:BrnT family toxin [bacterium]|nr:BrnT family toxin [bacterium]
MKYHNWNREKNELLKSTRGISFEDIIYYIKKGNLLDILENPNTKKYKDQKIYVIDIEKYVYLVPFIETDEEIFLKTIIPSRKATKQYMEENGEEIK